jgi:hypothetical protein
MLLIDSIKQVAPMALLFQYLKLLTDIGAPVLGFGIEAMGCM